MNLLPAALTAVMLSACSPGLDLYTPPDAREYIRLCARDKEGLGCQAILPVLRTVEGEVTVLLPNGDDRPELAAALARKGVSVENFLASAEAGTFARAHIFAAPKLQTGQMRTLDGRLHDVNCRAPTSSEREFCDVDGRIGGFNVLDNADGPTRGSVYLMTGLLPF
ncbi:hypothetical protein [Deinococcus planocerae]|uniref:hypothetical protein n=1 Tax=Deinococcus planocerae TaxID=1737569 RepID=UPI000C7F33F7|nr:hypothetical protein [Deinococcus planocerae]